jgi:hypothetical protein
MIYVPKSICDIPPQNRGAQIVALRRGLYLTIPFLPRNKISLSISISHYKIKVFNAV